MVDSAPATLEGLVLEACEWLPSGADSGLLRVRGRWTVEPPDAELPSLWVRAGGAAQPFDSLPDTRFARGPGVWRGTYVLPARLMAEPPEELWLAWAGGAKVALPRPASAWEPPAVGGPEAPAEEPGGELIDRAVLADRRARRAEASQREQARVATEALRALEVLELRSAELERRLEELQRERDELAARGSHGAPAATAETASSEPASTTAPESSEPAAASTSVASSELAAARAATEAAERRVAHSR